jgi:hypothetical protein
MAFRPEGITEPGSGFHRHDIPARNASESDPVSEEYTDLTEGGVEHAKEVAREDLLQTVEDAPERALLFIGGKSDQARSGQTAEVWGEALKEIAQTRSDLLVLTKRDIDQLRTDAKKESGKTLESIRSIIEANPGKKIVIDFPLFIKQLGYGFEDRWTKKNAQNGKVEKTEYFSEILKKHNNNHAECIADWLQNDGRLTLEEGRTIQGPHPEDVARQYVEGLERLYRFAKTQAPDRPVMVHGVGHQWDLDAVATFLARGRVTYEDWQAIMGRPDGTPEEQVIGEGEEVGNIMIDPTGGKTEVEYRGQHFAFTPEQ